jgi:hypothetical protein
VLQSNATTAAAQRVQGDGNATGDFAALLSVTGQTLANGAQLFTDAIEYIAPIAVVAAQRLRLRCKVKITSPAGLFGCTAFSYLLATFFNAAGAAIGTAISANTTGLTTGQIVAEGIVPAGTARVQLVAQALVINSTGGSVPLTGECLRYIVDDIELFPLTNLDSDAADGAIHGRIAMQDVVTIGGVNRDGLRLGNSGQQIGDARNLPATMTASATAYWQGLSVTYTAAAGGTATVNVSAATLQRAGLAINYSAASINLTGLATGNTRVYLYYIDATSAGGARTLNATTDGINIANAPDRVLISSVVISVPSSGSGSGGGAINDGGGLGRIPPGGSVP